MTPTQTTTRAKAWALLKPYWLGEDRFKAWALLAAVVALVLGAVYLNVLFNDWNKVFYDALQSKDESIYKQQIWRFSYLAFFYIVVGIYRVYLTQMLEMRWRTWMTNQYLDKWLAHRAFYLIEHGRLADNPDQRIAEDLRSVTADTLSLTLGLLSSVVTLLSFIAILWQISGPISFALGSSNFTIPGYMVWFAVAYALVGSGLSYWVGRHLVGLNFARQKFEADFRFGLVRVREQAENIALYQGEKIENADLKQRFASIQQNWQGLMRATKRLNIVSTGYGQFAIIFPFLVGAPRYFAGTIKLGDLMQISSAFGQVQDALSWFINAFTSLASWRASVNRLAGFHASINETATLVDNEIKVERNNVGALMMDQLSINLPTGAPLLAATQLHLNSGDRVLIQGPSGCGKSTLLRALAGLWPHGSGTIEIPLHAKVMFVPQKSYAPIGSLRQALTYPNLPQAFSDAALHTRMEQVQLAHLIEKLDEHDHWDKRLSPGEAQRLALARALLTLPDYLFLDEATSALDAKLETELYELLLRELPKTTVVSVAHREAVARFHNTVW
jgi:putative ATP-binding cassette transporter